MPPVQILPSFDIVRVGPQGDAVLAGRGEPGARVVIADNGHAIASAQADARGQWVALPTAKLPQGGQQLTLSATAPQPGAAAVQGAAPVVVVVPPANKTASAGALALLTPQAGMPQLLQAPKPAPADDPAAAKPGKRPLGLGMVDYDAQGAIRFAGTAPPGSTVRVYVDRHAAGDALADDQGRWLLQPPAGVVGAGRHQLRLDQLTPRGAVSARVALPFDRVLLPDAAVLDGKVVVQPGQSLWRIARQAYGHGIRYTVIYLANRSEIRNPDMIYPGQIFAVPVLPGAAAANPAPVASSTSR